MIPKSLRIPRREYPAVMRSGKRIHQDGITVLIHRSQDAGQRFGVIVPKAAVKMAVKRNRTKRLIGEFIRTHRDLFPTPSDVIVIVNRAPKEFTGVWVGNALAGILAAK